MRHRLLKGKRYASDCAEMSGIFRADNNTSYQMSNISMANWFSNPIPQKTKDCPIGCLQLFLN